MEIQNIKFDIEDKTLFQIDNLQLKADAIRYSILPKLEIIANEVLSKIIDVYKVDFYEYSILAKSPRFRENIKNIDRKFDYRYCSVNLTGKRNNSLWLGLDKEDKNTVATIVPFRLCIELSDRGFVYYLKFGYPANFSNETYKKYYDFLIDNSNLVQGLLSSAFLNYNFSQQDGIYEIKDFVEIFKLKISNKRYKFAFYPSEPIPYPINSDSIEFVIRQCIKLFPLDQSFVDIALGVNPIFNLYLDCFNKWANTQDYLTNIIDYPDSEKNLSKQYSEIKIPDSVNQKVRATPGMRWLVFKRDNWKCVACGRSAKDNVILHVDHIVPRSKGGRNELSNYQTLCENCNIGKSNRDDTDLRNNG